MTEHVGPTAPGPLKRFLFAFSVLLVSLAALTFVAYRLALPSPRAAEREQYVIYSAYLNRGLTGGSHDLGDRSGTTLIYHYTIRTGPPPRAQLAVPRLLGFELRVENLLPRHLQKRFAPGFRYALIPTKELTEDMMKRYPGSYGIIMFSTVAFDRQLTEALFYTVHACGLCGGDEWVYMRKINGIWTQVGSASSWVS